MKMAMSISKNFNLNNIKFDLSKELNNSIDIVALDIKKGIEKGVQFEVPFKRNAPMTIKKKGFDHPLKETGLMMNETKMIKGKASQNNQIATLLPNEKRIDIALWNDRGTDDIPARPFWGISKKVENEIIKRIEGKIEQEIKRA